MYCDEWTYPEYIIHEETTQQDASSAHFVQGQQLDTIDSKSYAKQVVGQPMLEKEI